MQDLNITIVQADLHWENADKNLSMFSEKIAAIQEHTDLIVLPEMFSTGFTMNNKAMAESMKGKAIGWMKKMAKEKKCVVTGSVIIEENGNYFNRLVWMRADGSMETYDKRHLFRYANEQDHYSAGNKKLIVDLNGWKICPLVCYDLRFPVWIRNQNKEYDVVLFVANWPERRNHPWKTLLMARAMENQAYVVGVNRIGNDGNNIYHSGDSAVINFKGEIISTTKPHEASVETVTLSAKDLIEWRKTFPAWMDADKFQVGSGQ